MQPISESAAEMFWLPMSESAAAQWAANF